jgi:hypothetical protein
LRLYKRHRVIRPVPNGVENGLHNKPKVEVHPGHLLTGHKEEEEEDAVFRSLRVQSTDTARCQSHWPLVPTAFVVLLNLLELPQ